MRNNLIGKYHAAARTERIEGQADIHTEVATAYVVY